MLPGDYSFERWRPQVERAGLSGRRAFKNQSLAAGPLRHRQRPVWARIMLDRLMPDRDRAPVESGQFYRRGKARYQIFRDLRHNRQSGVFERDDRARRLWSALMDTDRAQG